MNVAAIHRLLTRVLVAIVIGTLVLAIASIALDGSKPRDACPGSKPSALQLELVRSAEQAWDYVRTETGTGTKSQRAAACNVAYLQQQLKIDDRIFIPFYVVVFCVLALWAITASPQRPVLGVLVILLVAAIGFID